MINYILYNVKTGNGTGENKAFKLKEYYKGETVFKDITKINDYKSFFDSINSEDKVTVCGGDGTISRFANDTYDLDYPNEIYYYPTGTGNDFWREIGDINNPVPLPVGKYLKNLPTVTVNGKKYRFINGVGYGIDGYCCEVGDKMRLESDKPVNYTSIAIKGLLFHYKTTNAVVTVDGKEHRFNKVWLAPTMNGLYYGGGMMPTPNQKRISEDKKLSVMVMSGKGKIKTLIAFPGIFEGKHVNNKMTTILTGKKITVKFDTPTALQIDGETITGVTEYTAEV